MCRLSEPAPGLIPWLTVRHHRASTGFYWRRGVFLRHPIEAYASEALLELRAENELALEVRAPSPDLYFNALRDSIENLITVRWPGLTYKLFIPCPGTTANMSACPGQFRLNTLLRLRERKRTSVLCMECIRDYQLSELLTGFSAPEQPLAAKLEEIYSQLITVRGSVQRTESQAAEIAESVRKVVKVVNAEVTDCPRLFTLAPQRPAGRKRLRLDQDHYRLTLWCEHPGYWHPWFPASYELDLPKEWVTAISPYMTLVLRTLQLVIPITGSVADILLSPDDLARARSALKFMNDFVSELPREPENGREPAELAPGGQLTAAEGSALRGLRAVLFEHDRPRKFGDLRRVQAPSSDFVWVCPHHYADYDPGLPSIPDPEPTG